MKLPKPVAMHTLLAHLFSNKEQCCITVLYSKSLKLPGRVSMQEVTVRLQCYMPGSCIFVRLTFNQQQQRCRTVPASTQSFGCNPCRSTCGGATRLSASQSHFRLPSRFHCDAARHALNRLCQLQHAPAVLVSLVWHPLHTVAAAPAVAVPPL